MKFYCLKHVLFEGPENIEEWAIRQGHEFVVANAFQNQFPQQNDFDVLVLMGGSMSANDDKVLPWMATEKKLIESAIKAGKKIIGVCLGAQLIANVLGAKVYKNKDKEIGWFPVEKVSPKSSVGLLDKLPASFPVFHWHGETFDLPKGSIHLLKSDACKNQAFLHGGNILALQFHMEGTRDGLIWMMENSLDEMTPGKYVQDQTMIHELTRNNISQTEIYFKQLMDNFFKNP